MNAVTVLSAVTFVICSQQINISCHLIHRVIGFIFSTLCCINLQTTSVHALARQLLGSAYSNGVLELNASDSRGIDVSQTYMKYYVFFCRLLTGHTLISYDF